MTDYQGKRILLYTASLAGGGAEKVFVNLAEAFGRKGLDVTLAVDRFEGDYCETIDRTLMHLIDLQAPSTRAAIAPLAALYKKMQPDVVLSALVYNNLAAIRAGLQLPQDQRPRIYVTNHTATRQHLKYTFPPLKTFVTLRMVQWFYPKAWGVTGVSKGVCDDLSGFVRLPRSPVTLYNPVLPDNADERYATSINNPELENLPRPVFLAVGRLTQQKGFHDLVEAFALYRKQYGQGTLVILGQGEEKGSLLALADTLGILPHFHLPGFQKDIFPFYPWADVLVMSSYWEGFGNVLVEAMAAGTPVVSTDCPSGPAEILENGRYGLLVPVQNPAEMAEAMHEALHAPEEQLAAARARASSFCISTITDQYLEYLFGQEQQKAG